MEQRRRLFTFAGGATVVSGVLFFAKGLLEWRMGWPPRGAELMTWIDSRSLELAITNEVCMFAAVLLIPGIAALYERLAPTHRVHAVVATGLLATTIPLMAALVVVHGRLMYPMFGIQAHTSEIAEFILATYFGGLHAVALMHSAAIVTLSLAMRPMAGGRRLAQLGWLAATFQVAGAYPDLVGPIPVLVASGIFAAWLITMGVFLRRSES